MKAYSNVNDMDIVFAAMVPRDINKYIATMDTDNE